jgi:nucleoside-diphosphate-sugar epimerase
MRHVITGGAGFIGSHLADALVARGEEVLVVDDFSRGKLANLAQARETGLCRISPFVDLRYDQPTLTRGDAVWHLAAKVASIEYNRRNQYDMLASNLAINANVIEAVRKARPSFFCYVSTACVYPHDAPVPTPEWAGDVGNPEPTNHGYGVAKWVGEQMVKHLSKEHNLTCLIPRFFNAYGLRDYYDKATSHVVPALIRRVMEGENPVTVWGTGRQTRVFVDAEDIAKALVMLYDHDWTGYEGTPVVNVGHEREVSIAEVVDTIIRCTQKDVGRHFDDTKPDGHARRAADVTLLRETIGWVPDTPLEVTVAKMVAEYRK